MIEGALPLVNNRFIHFGLGIPLLVISILAMMILPIPTFLLDFFFTFNIALALVVLLVGSYSRKPLDFSIFPTVLLVATLLRLALNIASTRIVLLYGHTGGNAAGEVIHAFGEVVIGGSYAVGLVVFAILVIINFVVVTKGAGRVSEVSARFTLDSMPGKQMAIDADLNAGIIDQDEAKNRREEVAQEADFYGAMDGASKFVRGDAIAGILILFINILGGFIIGVVQHDLSATDAMRVYALLTIGDGLVAQIPSLLLSTAAAIMVTRVSGNHDMSSQVRFQMFKQPKPMLVCAAIMIILGLIPNMPHFAFLSIGILCALAAYIMQNLELLTKNKSTEVNQTQRTDPNEIKTGKQPKPEVKELSWDDVPLLDAVCVEVGYRIIPFVDEEQGGELMHRIKGVRKKLSQEVGFLFPSVHIRDNLNLLPNSYTISLNGVEHGKSEIQIDKLMAINPGQVFGELEGISTHDPAFNLEAKWIEKSMKEQAQTLGYTVVDPSTVIATHLSQILQSHSHELLGHEEAKKMLDLLAKSAANLVDSLVPDQLSLTVVVRVLQSLLEENVPIRDLRTIVETLSEYASKSQDPAILTEACRSALSRHIIQQINGQEPEVPVMTLDPKLEQILQQSLQTIGQDGAGIEPNMAEKLQSSLVQFVENQEINSMPAIVLVPSNLRRLFAKFVKYGVKGLSVLAYNEIPDGKQIKIISTLGEN